MGDANGYGAVLRSPDRGLTWTEVLQSSAGDLLTVRFLNDSLGWAFPGLRTTDGGGTWIADATLNDAVSIQFVDALHWWITFYDGTLRNTADGGATWYTYHVHLSYGEPYFLSFADTSCGWVVT